MHTVQATVKEPAAMQAVSTSVKNAAFLIGIGRTKVYELINQGKLETISVGRRRLVKTSSIRALVEMV